MKKEQNIGRMTERSKGGNKQRRKESKEAKMQRSKEAKKQRSKEAKKQRSKEEKKERRKEGKNERRKESWMIESWQDDQHRVHSVQIDERNGAFWTLPVTSDAAIHCPGRNEEMPEKTA